jgi:hypothetical protein
LINIPESVTTIGSSAFEDCTDLTEISLPKGLKKLANSTFQNCSSLYKVLIPASMTTIGKAAFMGCSMLMYISFRRVTSIGEDAFRDCTCLEKVNLPANITEINYRAFQGCKSLTTVRMGNSVESLFSHAFGDCPALKEVYCPMEKIPSTSADVFEGTPLQQATLYVPASLLTAYKAVTPWKEFGQHTSIGGQSASQQQAEEQGSQNSQSESKNGQTGKKWTTIYVNGEEQ